MKKSMLFGFFVSLFFLMNGIPELSKGDSPTSNTSNTVEVTLLGPKQYIRTTGKPNIYADTFPGRFGQGKLIVKNGDANGDNRISSAIIKINGIQVLGTNDFNQNVYMLEVPLSLQDNNNISVDLRSKPGSYLNITIKEEVKVDAEMLIGPGGGTVEVDDPTSLIYRAKIEIPQGALAEDTMISIYQELSPPPISLPNFQQNLPIINFTTSFGTSTFAKPIKITLPIRNFDLYEPEIPAAICFNEEISQWESVLTELNIDDATLTFETSHFSLYTIINIILAPEIYNKLVAEYDATLKLIQLARGISQSGISCSSLNDFINLFRLYKNNSYEIMEIYSSNYEACFKNVFPCGGVDFQDWFQKQIEKKIIITSCYEFLKLAGLGQVGLALVKSIGPIIGTPCMLCILSTSTLNPDFWRQLAIYNAATKGSILAEKTYEQMNCSGGEEIFFSNFDDGTLQGWGTIDYSCLSSERAYSGNYSIKVNDILAGGNEAEVYRIFQPGVSKGRAELMMYIPSGNSAGISIFLSDKTYWQKYPSTRFQIYFETNGQVYWNQGGWHQYSNRPIAFNTWNKVILSWDCATNEMTLNINGYDYGIAYNNNLGGSITQLTFQGMCWICTGIYAWFDDIKVVKY